MGHMNHHEQLLQNLRMDTLSKLKELETRQLGPFDQVDITLFSDELVVEATRQYGTFGGTAQPITLKEEQIEGTQCGKLMTFIYQTSVPEVYYQEKVIIGSGNPLFFRSLIRKGPRANEEFRRDLGV